MIAPVADPRPLWAQAFEDAVARLDRVASGLTNDDANWKPAPDRWSVADCIDHLNVTAELYLPGMEMAALHARKTHVSGSPPYRRGPIAGRFLISFLDPAREAPKRAKAPSAFRPAASDHDLEALVQRFHVANQRFLELLERCDGLAMGKVRFGTPISRWLRVSLAQAFEIHAVHQHRHLAQAESVRGTAGFPAGFPA